MDETLAVIEAGPEAERAGDVPREDYYELLLEVNAEAARRGMTFREAAVAAYGAWMVGRRDDRMADSNLMPEPKMMAMGNGVAGRAVDPKLFAAICALGMPPERIRLDRKKYGPAKIRKIIALAAEADPGRNPLVFFKAADGMMIVHRASGAGGQRPEETPAPRTRVDPPTVDVAAVLRALDKKCPKPGDSTALVDLGLACVETAEGRSAVRDALKAEARYMVDAPFAKGRPGRTLTATRLR